MMISKQKYSKLNIVILKIRFLEILKTFILPLLRSRINCYKLDITWYF